MKRLGNLIESIADYDNLLLAYLKARKGKQSKYEVIKFSKDLDKNITTLREAILSGKVYIGRYNYFKIRDPKPRIICAAQFMDRVLHHAIMNICHYKFDSTLIADTYATRPNKGIYLALDKAVKQSAKYKYIVKLDYRKYFDNIDHNILKQQISRHFKDPQLLNIFNTIIDSYCVKEGKGVPIGNLTSQYFANHYLSELDHLMKEKIKVPIYIRYMDDILIMDNDKEHLKEAVALMQYHSSNKLFLTLKPPIFSSSEKGIQFLGYKIKPNYLTLSGRSKRRFKRKYRILQTKLLSDEITQEEYKLKIEPLLAFVKHASSKTFVKHCIINKDNYHEALIV